MHEGRVTYVTYPRGFLLEQMKEDRIGHGNGRLNGDGDLNWFKQITSGRTCHKNGGGSGGLQQRLKCSFIHKFAGRWRKDEAARRLVVGSAWVFLSALTLLVSVRKDIWSVKSCNNLLTVEAVSRVAPSSFDECILSARWPPTLRPSQLTWAVSPLVGCCHPHHHCHLLLLFSPKADTHLPSPGGWKAEST